MLLGQAPQRAVRPCLHDSGGLPQSGTGHNLSAMALSMHSIDVNAPCTCRQRVIVNQLGEMRVSLSEYTRYS